MGMPFFPIVQDFDSEANKKFFQTSYFQISLAGFNTEFSSQKRMEVLPHKFGVQYLYHFSKDGKNRLF